MLSRVEDVRVFESSEDVIIRSSSRRSYSCHQQLNGVQHQLRNRVTDEQIEVEEDEQLHPQHPYRMRKRVLQQEYEDFNHLEEVDDEMLVPSRKQESNRPMEFVFLSSGEIRAREDCPPGLELPKLQQDHDAKTNRRLEYQTEAYSSEESEEVREYQGQNRRSQRVMKASRQQKEKKRVLEKMTQLLDEQGKNQQLRDRVEALEAQLAAKESETSNTIREAIREHEVQTQSIEKKQAELEEQVRLQEATIARLKNDKDQLKAAVKQLKKTASNPPSDQHLDSNKATNLRTELDDMTRVLEDFLAKVERWKDKTKKELQNCEDMSDLPALLEQKWLKFPQFPGVSARPHKESSGPLSEQQSTPGTEEQDAVLFLKKRLRQREEELRQTHVKFVELKEICARQCVREADLQNFINEHRLRGNLIIRKNSDTKPNEVATNQESVPDEHQDERRSANSKLKMISSRGTNTPASYPEDEDNFVNDEYSDNQEDNDEYEEGEEYGYPVRAPKVFVQETGETQEATAASRAYSIGTVPEFGAAVRTSAHADYDCTEKKMYPAIIASVVVNTASSRHDGRLSAWMW
ncbi:hypothetical protein JG687_00003198 [Phytophthora cactorum]|uniref:Uncharacterized protein n=1 Tax=Phytophthora cactorum TaxID=29920 RepID=A0A8T1UWC2_9STRA|nr:hypothetical protein JG687_00003198 [Phytophthora cactorum]